MSINMMEDENNIMASAFQSQFKSSWLDNENKKIN